MEKKNVLERKCGRKCDKNSLRVKKIMAKRARCEPQGCEPWCYGWMGNKKEFHLFRILKYARTMPENLIHGTMTIMTQSAYLHQNEQRENK